MKNKIVIAITFLMLFSSCSLDDESNSAQYQTFRSFWHLARVTGGIAGVDNQFELDTVIWSFDEDNNEITVENNNTDDTKQDGLNSGVYSYETTAFDTKEILIIDNQDFGEIYLDSQNVLVIDQNETTMGSGADGFVYTFQRVVVAE
ncbi:hypothetical protein [Hyunsoonleella aestuarii]|uniref:Lipocalin-like domain-containing protein n=1 Tax=Hyunsoonleella aestuarii TaxID=912802 RepID=A0ABP8EBR5_9FLAO|nr:hypothetical protein [Hyunsoonleella aestuarii]